MSADLSRYIVSLVFFAAAGYVWHYNGSHEGSYILLPLLDAVGDLKAQSAWTWRILAAIGALTLIQTLIEDGRDRGA